MSHPDDVALTGGSWHPVSGVQRWIPDPPPLHLTVRVYGPVPELADKPESLACPLCGSSGAKTCRTKEGHRTKNHKARTVPRTCDCGVELKWKCRMCDDCAEEAARMGRQRSRERHAA